MLIPEVKKDQINNYIQLLKEYNETTNIYSKNSYDKLNYHINDSAILSSFVSPSKVHVDLGSGSGLPGIIIAILSNCKVICIESRLKKREFLSYAKIALDLTNLHIFDGDVQLFTSRYSGAKINTISAKAFAKPPKLLWYLNLFRGHQISKDAICYVPVSENQVKILSKFDEVLTKHVESETYYFFKVHLAKFQEYRVSLKSEYTL